MNADIGRLLPHGGRMVLLERVISWDSESARLATASHRDESNPLRRGGRLSAVHLCEYGAQAMAVHGSLLNAAQAGAPAGGYLVSLRDVVLGADHVEELPGELTVLARRVAAGAGLIQYGFWVWHDDRELARGRATVWQGGR